MKKRIGFLTLFVFVAIGIHAQKATKAHKDSLNTLVKSYYKQNIKIFQSNSTVKDIDKVFDLFTEDFTYVHPKYGGTYTRQNLYDGYVRNQKNGGYNGSIVDIKVVDKIIGLNAVVVKRRYIKKEDGKLKEGDAHMTLFEFKNGKISRIFEYW